jgi:hypothetical protein
MADEIHTQLLLLYGEAIYISTTIYKWIREFRIGRTSVFDESRFDRPLVVERLPPGISFNSKYFCDIIALVSHGNITIKVIFLSYGQCQALQFKTTTEFLLIKIHKNVSSALFSGYSID